MGDPTHILNKTSLNRLSTKTAFLTCKSWCCQRRNRDSYDILLINDFPFSFFFFWCGGRTEKQKNTKIWGRSFFFLYFGENLLTFLKLKNCLLKLKKAIPGGNQLIIISFYFSFCFFGVFGRAQAEMNKKTKNIERSPFF